MASPHIMCASLSEVELIQTPINNKQQGDNPVSEEQLRNAEFSPSARLAYLFVLLSKHHTIKALTEFYILLTVHLDVILVNDQLHALFLNAFHASTCF
jgi:hypothetical protein